MKPYWVLMAQPSMREWESCRLTSGLTVLTSIIGEDNTLSIKVGADVGDPNTEDVILVRGISSEVSRAVKDILKIIADAKNDEIVNSHVRIFLSVDRVLLIFCSGD